MKTIIIYYRDREEKIVSHQEAPDDKTLEELNELARKFNLDSEKTGKTGYIEVVEADSLTAYLLRKVNEIKKRNKEDLLYAIDSANAVLGFLEALEE